MPREPRECPPGKIRNPSTRRCVDTSGPTGRVIRMAAGANVTPCPPGYTRDRATGRCIRARPANAAARTCPANMILNPASGRCVKVTGAIGRRLAAAAAANRTPNRAPNRTPNRTPYFTPAATPPAAPGRPERRRRTTRPPRRIAPMATLPTRTPSPAVATPSTPSLANLSAKCSNDTDPIMLTNFKNMNRNELKSIVAIGRGEKKHCFLLDTIYRVYETAVRDNQPVKDPLDPSYILSDAEIRTINRMMKKRDPSYVPPRRTLMNYKGYELNITPDGNYFRLKIVRSGRMAMDLGYIPGDVEATNTGSTDTTSATMVAALRELWDQRRMLRSVEPLRVNGMIHLRKQKTFWRTNKIQKFRDLMGEIQRFRGSYT